MPRWFLFDFIILNLPDPYDRRNVVNLVFKAFVVFVKNPKGRFWILTGPVLKSILCAWPTMLLKKS